MEIKITGVNLEDLPKLKRNNRWYDYYEKIKEKLTNFDAVKIDMPTEEDAKRLSISIRLNPTFSGTGTRLQGRTLYVFHKEPKKRPRSVI